MVRAMVGSFLVLLAASAARSAENPAVTTLRQQVKALKAQQKTVVKAIQAQYNAVINQGSLTEAELRAMRAAVRKQERQQMALTTSGTDKEAIRQQYDLLRQGLSGKIALDGTQIAQLRRDRNALTTLVNKLYSTQIKEMEAQIRALRGAGKSSTAHRKK